MKNILLKHLTVTNTLMALLPVLAIFFVVWVSGSKTQEITENLPIENFRRVEAFESRIEMLEASVSKAAENQEEVRVSILRLEEELAAHNSIIEANKTSLNEFMSSVSSIRDQLNSVDSQVKDNIAAIAGVNSTPEDNP
jgi:chromosome segregation ATPase